MPHRDTMSRPVIPTAALVFVGLVGLLAVAELLAAMLRSFGWNGWLSGAAVALLLATGLTTSLTRLVFRSTADPSAQQTAERALADVEERHRQLRHDLRGVLSPALLVSERLLINPDPKVQRVGTLMVQTVEKASALLSAREDGGDVSRPGCP